MTLNAFAAEKRLKLFDELKRGSNPSEGSFDAAALAEGRMKGAPQIGTTRYEPRAIVFEFIFPDPRGGATVMPVRLDAPERIVFLPVPEWVIESIWQGDIDGSFHFESDAVALVESLKGELTPEGNAKWFEKRLAKRRE